MVALGQPDGEVKGTAAGLVTSVQTFRTAQDRELRMSFDVA